MNKNEPTQWQSFNHLLGIILLFVICLCVYIEIAVEINNKATIEHIKNNKVSEIGR